MCQISIDRVDADTLQQATTLHVLVSGTCDHGGDAYLRVLREDGGKTPETPMVQVNPTFQGLDMTYTVHNLSDHVSGVRAVLRCKATSVYAEAEV